MKKARSGRLDNVQFVNIKNSEKLAVVGGYYFVDGERFVGFIRMTKPTEQGIAIGDFVCCLQTGCAFEVVERADQYTYVISGVCAESSEQPATEQRSAPKPQAAKSKSQTYAA